MGSLQSEPGVLCDGGKKKHIVPGRSRHRDKYRRMTNRPTTSLTVLDLQNSQTGSMGVIGMRRWEVEMVRVCLKLSEASFREVSSLWNVTQLSE